MSAPADEGAQSPQGPSQPGPTYPHPDAMNDPVPVEEQTDRSEQDN
jgi:hypothetical protein